ncbi:hypothetical protein [Rhodanobacter sp. MP7CTX1]|uniref:hypothetical protein n=1 Tax=Rhodanobacter sp. MP7CTX1 TaxID=2723084 RepID=UPI0016120C21|nr:hypothetical protein [Rhodanobacter sp. MP7CTX1]MBB6185778.1 hypothetical protein [Rhodanobacter sp. MP7CTX1]
MILTIHAPTPEALKQIAERMCAEDRAEIEASRGGDPLDVLTESVGASRESYVAWWDGKPQAMFGVADFTYDTDHGVPWMLSTGAPPARVARQFIAASRKYVAAWLPMYVRLFNMVDLRHLRAQRWLLSLGFHAARVHDIHGYPFIEFEASPN